jgi:integrase
VAFILLTGARDSAIASMKLKHVDLKEGCVHQDATRGEDEIQQDVYDHFFPVGEEVRGIVAEWVRFLREEKLWGNDDPLFPATRIALGRSRQFEAAGLGTGALEHGPADSGDLPRGIRARGLALLPAAQLAQHAGPAWREQLCTSPEEFKAWSQNLGHEQVLTTFMKLWEGGH